MDNTQETEQDVLSAIEEEGRAIDSLDSVEEAITQLVDAYNAGCSAEVDRICVRLQSTMMLEVFKHLLLHGTPDRLDFAHLSGVVHFHLDRRLKSAEKTAGAF